MTIKTEPLLSVFIDEEGPVLKLILMFIDQLPGMLNDIKELYKAENWEVMAAKVHSLKGTGGNFGFYELTDVAAKIEEQFEMKSYSRIEALLDELEGLRERIVAGTDNYKR